MKRGGPIRRKKPLRAKKPLQSKKGLASGAGPKRKKMINAVNKKRKKKEFARTYDSVEYVKHLHQFPCEVCGVYGWTVAAHTETGGTGYKADADTLVPLCGSRPDVKGCHEQLDDYEIEEHRLRLQRRAKHFYRQWQKQGGGDD